MQKTFFIALLAVLMTCGSVSASIYGDTIEYEIQGKITFKSGTIVKIQQLSGEETPAVGAEGVLSKKFETELFGGKVSGWLSIGEMKVTRVADGNITFTLTKELSVVTENGVKKNHFEIGREVKFVWRVPYPADEAEFKKGQDAVDTNMFLAFVHYKNAIAINPRNDKALNMIGIIMNEQKIEDSALYYFKKAFEADPKNVQYAKNICITSFKSGMTGEGYDYAMKAVNCDNKDAEAWYLRAVMHYAMVKDSLKDAEKQLMLADISKAIQLTPDDPFYYEERAFFQKTFGDSISACTDARKAKELGSEKGDALVKEYCP
jgi:tetratricopeptide (TPR) repeat protein